MPHDRPPNLLLACAYLISLALPALVALSGPASADTINLVTNGTFSSTSLSGTGGFLCANTGGTTCTSAVASWSATCATGGCTGTKTPSSVLFAGSNGSAWNNGSGLYWNGIGNAPLGGNVIGIDGDAQYTSVLSQSVSGLKVGETYLLQFYQAASQQTGLSGKTTEQWSVSLGGGTSQISALQNTASQSASPWTTVAMRFVANATSETLQFVALGTPAGEPPVVLLSDVSMVDIPEPAGLAVVAVGLLGFVRMRRKVAR